MKTLQIYIVEDEPLIVVNIKMALQKQGIQVAGSSPNYVEAKQGIERTRPHLVLLDIQLEDAKDGIDLALWLEKAGVPYLYLTSQTDPNTLDRVKETQPLGYIVKPFTEAGLLSNIELAWHKILANSEDAITIKSEGRSYRLNQGTILYLKAFDNYCYLVTASKEYLVPHTLKKMAHQLNPEHFAQVHRSYWVNLPHVTSITSEAVFIGANKIPLSYSRKEEIRHRLQA